MPKNQTTSTPSFRSILDIAFYDAAGRAEMWGDFGQEFVRLGLLANAMRGPERIVNLAEEAASICHDEMEKERGLAVASLEVIRKTEASVPKDADLNADAPTEPRTLVATELQSEAV